MALRVATLAIVALHLGLLLASLPDYRVSVDSAYHTALGRRYGERLVYFWDDVHYAPAGRPNLQGPAVHFAIGMLGRALGGEGDDYVRANALLAVAGWVAAIGTVWFFARRHGGDRAALLAVAVLSGSAFASGSFYVNLPSGWMFVATPWAIHFFLVRRLVVASLFGAIACYTHLGGFATVSIGILVAALLCGRLRDLVLTGGGIGLLTAPYWVHFLRSLDWYVGRKGDSAWMFDPLVDLFWVLGVLFALHSPRRRAFLVAWAAAPLVWLFQDTSRFILQSSLAGATLGGVAVGDWLGRAGHPAVRAGVTVALVVLATVFPLGMPSLGAEVSWLVKPYGRILDWSEMRADAEVIRRSGLEDRLVSGYASYVASALAVWADIRAEKGHWVEVQPAIDPADALSVSEKAFVLAVPPSDEALGEWQAKGWLRVHGGGRWTSVVTFGARPPVREALVARDTAWARDAAWIAAECEHNTIGDWRKLYDDPAEIPRREKVRGECRSRVARMQVAQLLVAYALEPADPERAAALRGSSRGLGWLSSLAGDESTLDFRTAADHARMRDDMAEIARAAAGGGDAEAAGHAMLARVLGGARGGLLPPRERKLHTQSDGRIQ